MIIYLSLAHALPLSVSNSLSLSLSSPSSLSVSLSFSFPDVSLSVKVSLIVCHLQPSPCSELSIATDTNKHKYQNGVLWLEAVTLKSKAISPFISTI